MQIMIFELAETPSLTSAQFWETVLLIQDMFPQSDARTMKARSEFGEF
jgi:hypothetical protein